MEKDYKIVTRQIVVLANSSMNVEVDCNSFIIKTISGFGYINNMFIANGGEDVEVYGNKNENLKQTLTVRTGNSALLLFVIEKIIPEYTKDYKLIFTLITKPTNFEVNCLDMQFLNKSGMVVYIDNMPLYSMQSLKISANPNERIKQTFYITTDGSIETELWVIQRI